MRNFITNSYANKRPSFHSHETVLSSETKLLNKMGVFKINVSSNFRNHFPNQTRFSVVEEIRGNICKFLQSEKNPVQLNCTKIDKMSTTLTKRIGLFQDGETLLKKIHQKKKMHIQSHKPYLSNFWCERSENLSFFLSLLYFMHTYLFLI